MIILLVNGCGTGKSKNDYLRVVLDNLQQITSASYYDMIESYAPGDTSPAFTSLRYYKEFRNPADTTIGSSYVWLEPFDTSRLVYYYDGKANAYLNWTEKTIPVDSFQNNNLPFRPLSPPFFNRTENIIKYVLETKDTVTTTLVDFGDSLLFKLSIYSNQQVEFFGKPYHLNNPYSHGNEISKYEIWINKSNNLPYRLRREMSHDISISNCRNIKVSTDKNLEFQPTDYFPSDFAIISKNRAGSTIKNDLLGKFAPEWVLKDANDNTFSLRQIKSKSILLEFTSVSCGPCLASIPFLKKLVTEYSQNDFDFISIESWTKNSNVLKSYQRRNNFNYKFVMSNDDVTKNYQIRAVPVFYILDKSQVIRKVIVGYREGTTDQEIRNALKELI